MWPGHTPEATTVERIKADLRGGKRGRALFVAAAGRPSEAHREALARGVGQDVLAVPMGAIAEVKTEVLSRPGRYRTIAESLLGPKRWSWAPGSAVGAIASASIPKRPSAKRSIVPR